MDGHGSLLNIDSTFVGDSPAANSSASNIIQFQVIHHQPYEQLIACIDHQTVILTSNNQLSEYLHKQYHDQQITAGHLTWETPDILPMVSWLQRCWIDFTSLSFTELPHLLNPTQEQLVWESILRESNEFENLLQIAESARSAQKAWRLLKQYGIEMTHPLLTITDAYKSMYHWGLAFQQRCVDHHWIDNASIPTLLMHAIDAKQITLPKKIIIVGFDYHTPQLEALFASCEKQSHVSFYKPLNKTPQQLQRCHAADFDHEILTMARWAKAIQQMHPTARIGCVVPTLNSTINKVEQIFLNTFAVNDTDPLKKPKLPFTIQASKPLIHYPIIQAALTLLQLLLPCLSVETFNYILATPFVGEAEQERVKRAGFDKLLRQQNVINVSLNQLLSSTETNNKRSLTSQCPRLAKRLITLQDMLTTYPAQQMHAEWVTSFSSVLHHLGWPGERTITNTEYQTVKRWLNMLSEYKQLDQVSDKIDIATALAQLKQCAKTTNFQPQGSDASIRVMNLNEAAGLPFDYLWVSGMDDMSWPPPPKPHAFISKQLQREYHMPQATANWQLNAANRLMQSFMNTANVLIYSHALKADGIELETSPLIRAHTEISIDSLPLAAYESSWTKIHSASDLETLTDAFGPIISPDVTSVGGVSIIKNQAICPFRAFAEHRLEARELETPVAGLRATDRGNMIHQVMEHIWIKLKTHEALLQLSDSELHAEIDSAIVRAVNSESNSRANYPRYTQLERQRLKKLIWNWFQIEKSRLPFVVTANELKATITLDDLSFSCKIDRIDTLSDGRSLIIDYKTGKHNDNKLWFGDRPEEPQLPIYALSHPGIAAIAYAQINRSGLAMIGVGDDGVEMTGIKQIADVKSASCQSWSEQLTEWETTLTRLAVDFVNGVAVVDPKEKIKSCEFCTLQPLCRIHEEISHAD